MEGEGRGRSEWVGRTEDSPHEIRLPFRVLEERHLQKLGGGRSMWRRACGVWPIDSQDSKRRSDA